MSRSNFVSFSPVDQCCIVVVVVAVHDVVCRKQLSLSDLMCVSVSSILLRRRPLRLRSKEIIIDAVTRHSFARELNA